MSWSSRPRDGLFRVSKKVASEAATSGAREMSNRIKAKKEKKEEQEKSGKKVIKVFLIVSKLTS